MHVVVLSPHRDDAAFSCGMLSTKLLQTGTTVTVVNVCTVSDYAPWLGESGEPRHVQVSAVRAAEDLLFYERLRNEAHTPELLAALDLGWQDAPLRRAMRTEDVLGSSPSPVETEALAAVFAELPPADAVVVPLGLGGHVDHCLVRDAALAAFAPAHLLFYEDLPYASRMAQAAREPEAHAVLPFACEGRWIAGAPVVKRYLCLCYPSQVAADVVDEIVRYAEAHGGERFYAAPAAWHLLGHLLPAGEVAR